MEVNNQGLVVSVLEVKYSKKSTTETSLPTKELLSTDTSTGHLATDKSPCFPENQYSSQKNSKCPKTSTNHFRKGCFQTSDKKFHKVRKRVHKRSHRDKSRPSQRHMKQVVKQFQDISISSMDI